MLLPEADSPGRGLARSTSGLTDSAINELRIRGYPITEQNSDVRLDRQI